MAVRTILTATDLSVRSRHAVDRAAQLAHEFGAELRVVHVVPDLLRFDRNFEFQQSLHAGLVRCAQQRLESMRQSVQKRYGVSPYCSVVSGQASTAILEAQAAASADLVVIGAQGETEPGPMRALGGTTLKVVPECSVPLLIVRLPVDHRYRRVIVALGRAEEWGKVLEGARSFLDPGRCCVVHAWDTPFASRLAALQLSERVTDTELAEHERKTRREIDERLLEAGLGERCEVRVLRGDPRTVLIAELARIATDLVVLGKHVQAPGSCDRVGSTFLRLAYGADCDLLHVP